MASLNTQKADLDKDLKHVNARVQNPKLHEASEQFTQQDQQRLVHLNKVINELTGKLNDHQIKLVTIGTELEKN